MSDINLYWKKLVCTGERLLQEQGDTDAVAVIKNADLHVELNSHDNWGDGIDYWDLVFYLRYRDYTSVVEKKATIEDVIIKVLNQFHFDANNVLLNVIIKPILDSYIDWSAVLPDTKESTISIIQEEQRMLTDIATGQLSFKKDSVEDLYQERHRKILAIADRAGFDYPVTANTLAEWFEEVKGQAHYSNRLEYIFKKFSPILNTLRESDDNSSDVNFRQIASRSETIKKAIEDAEVFIREGKHDSAVDRIHTACHGYFRDLLSEHEVSYSADDGISALFTKLHDYYGKTIKPEGVAGRVKKILRSASGMINAVNELRNNNTIAHPNGQLIQKREAQLVNRLVNDIVNYIEDIEKGMS